MKTTKYFLAFLLSCNIGLGCKQIAYKSYIKDDFILFGSGGGFTGERQEYIFFSNGDLKLKNSFTKDTVFIKNHSFKTVKRVFKLANTKEIKSIQMNLTGNMTHFIKFYKNQDLVSSYSWADETDSLPQPLNELKTALNSLK